MPQSIFSNSEYLIEYSLEPSFDVLMIFLPSKIHIQFYNYSYFAWSAIVAEELRKGN